MVVQLDPVADHASGVLLALEAMTVDALFLERPDDPLDHTVLLRAVWRDELLLQAIATHQSRVVAAGKDQAIVRTQQERLRHSA